MAQSVVEAHSQDFEAVSINVTMYCWNCFQVSSPNAELRIAEA